jgi:uncharacterized membrane protein YedE/YeeE
MGMTINWVDFTPWASLLGGGLIGLSAVMLMAIKGRIAGISGILGSLMQSENTPSGHYVWRITFLLGLVLSGFFYQIFYVMPESHIDSGYVTMGIAGLLVGFGTRMGSGCTSGHAVCGLGRMSFRSLIATLTFMLIGFLTAFVFFHLIQG